MTRTSNNHHQGFYRTLFIKRHRLQSALFFIVLMCVHNPAASSAANSRLDTDQEFFNDTHITDDVDAREFLNTHAAHYQLKFPATLSFKKQQKSLSSLHYYFQQMLNGVAVDRAQIIVSVDLSSKKVVRVFSNTTHLLSQNSPQIAPHISAASALQTVWRTQGANSQLNSQPATRLVYITSATKPLLVYRINLSTNTRSGNWEYTVDAATGEILTIERLDTPTFIPSNFQRNVDPATLKASANTTRYTQALATFEAKSKRLKKASGTTSRTNGTALVFDPDPITALQNLQLTTNSPLQAFDAAYVTRTLNDIELSDGVYHLNGPWVKIEDTEEPHTTPSTTSDGHWIARRNEPAFQDAMAYFHIDQNQRYLQSLGFKDETGVQYQPISVDAQAAAGIHNAFYTFIDNRISLGVAENCPAMAEDADLLLHEYGHAIHFSINPNWLGGDTGAMGEGFADYWAASYSLTTTNGATFHPERIGNWVAFNTCWEDGRVATRTDTRYQQGRDYEAHVDLGDHWSDELWSAPLYQSLRDLMDQGIAHTEVDRIIVEAHFGLGSEVTIPEMAKAIVLSARQMYPLGPHAEVFRNNFVRQNILSDAISFENPQLPGTAVVDQIQPSDQLGFNIELHNNNNQAIDSLEASIRTTTPGVSLINTAPQLLNITAGAFTPLKIAAQISADIACGSRAEFSATIKYTDPETQREKAMAKTFSYLVGTPIIKRIDTMPNAMVSNNKSEKVSSKLAITGLPIDPKYFHLHIDLRIPTFFPPKISLTSPAGTVIYITGLPKWNTEAIGDIPDDFGYEGIFLPLANENPNGIWTLEVTQTSKSSPLFGILKSWGISTLSDARCESTQVKPITLDSIQFSPTQSLKPSNEKKFGRGTSINLQYFLRNNSQTPIDNVALELTSPLNIASSPESTSTSLAALSSFTGSFNFNVPESATCGSSLPLQITYSYNTPQGTVVKHVDTSITTGAPLDYRSSMEIIARDIPDNNTNGISGSIYVERSKAFNAANSKIHIALEHPNPADLSVSLRSPEGTEIELLTPGTSLPNYINDKFPDDILPATELSAFNGENPNGNWTINIKDTVAGNTGKFYSAGIAIDNELDCDANNQNTWPIAKLAQTQFDINEGQTITLNATASSDPDGDTLTFSYEQLEGPMQRLIDDTSAQAKFIAPHVTSTTKFSYKLKVSDYYGSISEEIAFINVNKIKASSSAGQSLTSSSTPSTPAGGGGGGGGGGGVISWLLLALLTSCCLGYKANRI